MDNGYSILEEEEIRWIHEADTKALLQTQH